MNPQQPTTPQPPSSLPKPTASTPPLHSEAFDELIAKTNRRRRWPIIIAVIAGVLVAGGIGYGVFAIATRPAPLVDLCTTYGPGTHTKDNMTFTCSDQTIPKAE